MNKKVIGPLLAALGLLVLVNLAVTRLALGLESSDAHFQRVRDLIPPVERVLAFASSGSDEELAASFERTASRLGFSIDTPDRGDVESESLVPIERMDALVNSYPPMLWQTDPQSTEKYSHVSLKYVDASGAVFQYSYYCGEAETTPSEFVPKARRSPGDGDYFVCYSLLAEVEEEGPVVKKALWRAYRGGSYNGFEEIMLFGALALTEVLVLLGGWVFFRMRTRKVQSA